MTTEPLDPRSSRAHILELETEVSRLKRALHGHLFDGESLSTREAIREELILQGLQLADKLTGHRQVPDRLSTKVRCQCGAEFASRCEFWLHRSDTMAEAGL